MNISPLKKFIPAISLSKRKKFVLATIFLLLGIIIIRMGLGELLSWRIRAALFAVASLSVTLTALYDQDYSGIEWLTLPILPAAFALSTALVYPLLPSRLDFFLVWPLRPETSLILSLLLKLIFLSIFTIGYYATLLTANIFNVAAVRSIQLLRVAHSIGFLATVATALMFYLVIGSLHLSSWLNLGAVFMVTLLLGLPAIWSVNLGQTIGKPVRRYSLLMALVLGEVAWVLSFWPVGVSIYALFLTAIFYELLGIIQYHLGEKLNKSVANEFVLVALVVFLLTIFTTVWGA